SNSADDFTIGVGSIYLDKLKIVKVEKILIHPSYIHKQKFDIAMLKLTQNLTFSNTIRPICLPEYSFEPLNSNKARVIGWGYKKFEMKKVSSVLQEVDLEIIPLERCQTIYMPLQQDIVRSQICTWSSGKDACSGDSGGPLFVYNGRIAVLYGIVSFGVTCADEYPGVFTAVSYYLNWINKIIQQH
ncbi:Serine protease 48, partial [Blomia tropicalis]